VVPISDFQSNDRQRFLQGFIRSHILEYLTVENEIHSGAIDEKLSANEVYTLHTLITCVIYVELIRLYLSKKSSSLKMLII